jgi:hypothetical protein
MVLLAAIVLVEDVFDVLRRAGVERTDSAHQIEV